MSFMKRMLARGPLVSLMLALVVLLVSSAVSATVMVYTDLARLVELSDVVVQGRIVDQDTFFDEKRQEIATVTTVEVERVFHGEKVGDTVQFRQWGGEWGGRLARIPGDALFTPYEEVILFLNDGQGEYAGMRYLTALGASKFTIYRAGKRAYVLRELGDLAFFDQETKEVDARPDEKYEYAAFTAELEALVAGIKGGGQ